MLSLTGRHLDLDEFEKSGLREAVSSDVCRDIARPARPCDEDDTHMPRSADNHDGPAVIAMQEELWQRQGQCSHELAKKIDAVFLAEENPVNVCLATVQHRVLSAIHTLCLLQAARHDYSFDAAVVLRGLYDVHLQGLYVLQEPAVRAQEFQDFIWVQTKDTITWIEESDSKLAESLRSNLFYSVGAPNVDAHYERVKRKFLTKKGDRCRSNWFKGTLADVAKSVGYLTEYQLMQPLLSGSVHSTPYAMTHGAGLPAPAFLNFGWRFVFRILGGIATHLKVEFDEQQRLFVETSGHSIAEFPVGV